MNSSFNSDGVQFVWDATSIALADTCLRKYEYKMIQGWESHLLSVHLRFGQHYATALEHFYKFLALGYSRDDALASVVLEALEDTWERPQCEVCGGTGQIDFDDSEQGGTSRCIACDGTGKGSGGAPWDSLDTNKTRETLIRSIVWYTEQFKEDSTTVVMFEGKPAVEHSFYLPVDNGVMFSGHLDRLVDYNGSIMVMDQKTTKSTISSNYFDQFHPNTQMSMYSFAGRAIFAMPVKGVIIDAAQIAVGFTRFERGMTFRSDSQLNEWYDDAMLTIEGAREATRKGHFKMNPSACGNYGGCEFRAVCARSPEVRPQFLKAAFSQGAGWDPNKRR